MPSPAPPLLLTRVCVLACALATGLFAGLTPLRAADEAPPETPQAQSEAKPADEAPQPETPPKPKPPSVREIIGLDELHRRLGRDTPTGAGIVAGHVEGNGDTYMPGKHKGFGAVAFVARSGQSKPFGHATATASRAYGPRALAPGVRIVHCFNVRHWMTDGYLHAGQPKPPATEENIRVLNHSWIGDPGPSGAHILRRVDYQIDTQDVIMCVGVNNGRDKPVPMLLGSAYNVIAVGTSTGRNSGGYTRSETAGRCKPDIVAPGGLTSFTTPAVTASAARLLEMADQMDGIESRAPRDTEAEGEPEAAAPQPQRVASRSEVIKAALLAGATKPKGWDPEPGKPLDDHLGAGVLNVNNAALILEGGKTEPGLFRNRHGWDFASLAPNAKAVYYFEARMPLKLSCILAWNRRVDGRTGLLKLGDKSKAIWVDVPRLANLDLALVRVNEDGSTTVVRQSGSAIDNIEHVYVPVLEPGRYRLMVYRHPDKLDPTWDYALAWRMEPVEEPTETDGPPNP